VVALGPSMIVVCLPSVVLGKTFAVCLANTLGEDMCNVGAPGEAVFAVRLTKTPSKDITPLTSAKQPSPFLAFAVYP
jgi:hypothetical protein